MNTYLKSAITFWGSKTGYVSAAQDVRNKIQLTDTERRPSVHSKAQTAILLSYFDAIRKCMKGLVTVMHELVSEAVLKSRPEPTWYEI